ncbi:recombination-associated protein RdgC [Methylomicrobium agile]|uniref:recombination-associated protein RdgC n=1 Tax=Methylomicrobium agile TaxID=39774 RepID=UPI0004DF8355|nr:recombination-associated protein RdgC [Methylomicrobium agile]
MFKNAIAFRLNYIPFLDPIKHPVREIGAHESQMLGWEPYEFGTDKKMTIEVRGFIFLKLNIQDKLIPPSVVDREVSKRVKKIETEQDRKVGKKEKTSIKDEVIFEFLPKAFVVESSIEAFIDIENRLLVVDTSSASKAELLVSFLRKTLGSLDCVPIAVQSPIAFILTNWVDGSMQIPEALTLTGDYRLSSPEGEKKAGMKGFSGDLVDLVSHLITEDSNQIIELSLRYQDDQRGELAFNFDENFRFKGIEHDHFDDAVHETAEASKLADCLVTGSLLSEVISFMTKEMGGEVEHNEVMEAA